MGDPITIASLVLTAVGTVSSIAGQKKQEKATKKRTKDASEADKRREAADKRRQDVVAQRRTRAAAAEARRKIGASVNLATAQGAGGAVGAQGSTIPGATGNVTSQLNANNSFVNTVTALGNESAAAGGEANRIAARPIGGNSFQTAGAVFTGLGAVVGDNKEALTDWYKELTG